MKKTRAHFTLLSVVTAVLCVAFCGVFASADGGEYINPYVAAETEGERKLSEIELEYLQPSLAPADSLIPGILIRFGLLIVEDGVVGIGCGNPLAGVCHSKFAILGEGVVGPTAVFLCEAV